MTVIGVTDTMIFMKIEKCVWLLTLWVFACVWEDAMVNSLNHFQWNFQPCQVKLWAPWEASGEQELSSSSAVTHRIRHANSEWELPVLPEVVMLPLPQENGVFSYCYWEVNNYLVIPISVHSVVLSANSALFFCLFWQSWHELIGKRHHGLWHFALHFYNLLFQLMFLAFKKYLRKRSYTWLLTALESVSINAVFCFALKIW